MFSRSPSGAGAESRQILGTAVLGGMLAATVLGMAVVPMLFYVVQTMAEKSSKKKHADSDRLAEDISPTSQD